MQTSATAKAARDPLALVWLGRLIDLALIVSGTLIVVLMFGNVISRFVFNFDVAWSTELTGFLMIWATFLGGAAATQRGVHMRVSEFVHLARGATRRIIELVICLAVAAILLQLTWFGYKLARGNMDQLSTVLYYPIGLQYAALPVGSLLALVYVMRDMVRLVRGRSPPEAAVEL